VNHARRFSSPSAATQGNGVALPEQAQQQIPLVGGTTERAVCLPVDLVRKCADEVAAFHLSLDHARVRQSQGWYADRLGISRGQFARMLKGSARFAVDASALAAKAAGMLPTPPVQAIARGRFPRPSQPCVARPARGASGGILGSMSPLGVARD
jgi:hypothetical protein